MSSVSEQCFAATMNLDLKSKERELLKQSYEAFHLDLSASPMQQRNVDALNGLIVSDSDTDDPEQYIRVSTDSSQLKEIVEKRPVSTGKIVSRTQLP